MMDDGWLMGGRDARFPGSLGKETCLKSVRKPQKLGTKNVEKGVPGASGSPPGTLLGVPGAPGPSRFEKGRSRVHLGRPILGAVFRPRRLFWPIRVVLGSFFRGPGAEVVFSSFLGGLRSRF